jgi:hypothetical protein
VKEEKDSSFAKPFAKRMIPKKIRSTASPRAMSEGLTPRSPVPAGCCAWELTGRRSVRRRAARPGDRASRSRDADRGVVAGRTTVDDPGQRLRRFSKRRRGSGDEQVGVELDSKVGRLRGYVL